MDQVRQIAETKMQDLNANDVDQAAKLESGSKTPGREKIGAVTKAQVKEIAEKKMKDLNCDTIEAAMRMVEGSARSMGIEVGE